MKNFDKNIKLLSESEFSSLLGKEIKKIRELYCLNQENFGSQINSSKQHISNIERGKSTPNVYTLYLASKVYDIPISKFDIEPNKKQLSLSQMELIKTIENINPSDEVCSAIITLLKKK